MKWWRSRGGYKVHEEVHEPRPISTVLATLNEWLAYYPSVKEVWAKGPQFDLAVLQGYYERCHIPVPWEYNAGKDLRTIMRAAERKGWEKKDGVTIPHVGLLDCRIQVDQLHSARAFLDM